jgi:hypothetical protein
VMSAAAVGKAVGDRSWRAWAGRKDGASFELSDLPRGLMRSMRWHFGKQSSRRASCPICFDEPSEKGWQRLWCGCAVCSACVGRWARTALEDSPAVSSVNEEHTAPLIALSCPVCSSPLRDCDTIDVLGRDGMLLEAYDTALRDALLRDMRDYRPCPSCSGGGFVSWGCIDERRRAAHHRATFLGLLVLTMLFAVGANTTRPFSSASECSLVICAIVAQVLSSVARVVASEARADAPLQVICPTCDERFAVASADAVADAATIGSGSNIGSAADDAWVRTNTRPCPRPSCGAPILKSGGCNAMKCGRCGLRFCWACMQSSTSCSHFACANGAPHGNASIWDTDRASTAEQRLSASQRASTIAMLAGQLGQLIAVSAAGVFCLRLTGSRHSSAVGLVADALFGAPPYLALNAVSWLLNQLLTFFVAAAPIAGTFMAFWFTMAFFIP